MKRVRFLALFAMLVLALSLMLSACGGDGGETTPAPSTPPVASGCSHGQLWLR